VEILRVKTIITLRDLAELKHYGNLKEVHLRWLPGSVNEVLPMLKRCANLRRLTLRSVNRRPIPSSEELRDFIMELKHLTFLHIIYFYISNCKHFKSEVDAVKAFILPHRRSFKFCISCCSKFHVQRVPNEFLV
jgi:hypothetical protein